MHSFGKMSTSLMFNVSVIKTNIFVSMFARPFKLLRILSSLKFKAVLSCFVAFDYF